MKFLFNLFLFIFALTSSADVTFKVDDVEPTERTARMVDASKELSDTFTGKIEAYKVPYEKISTSAINGFIHTVKLAYDHHLKLEITPDDIWLLICQGLAIHVNKNYKELKPLILKDPTPDDPLVLHVRRDDFIKGKVNPWNEVVAEFVKQIDQNTKDELLKLFVPDFSTTTPENKVVFGMTLMKTTDRYFEYEFDTFCGISEIILKGTPEDWMNLKKRIYSLDKFKLAWWTKELHPVIDEFIAASKGTPKIAFWKKIIKEKEESGRPLRINGWILKFFPYLASNVDKFRKNPFIETSPPDSGIAANLLPKGITHVKFKWNYLAESFDMEMCSGFIGANVDEKNVTRSAIGWVIKEYAPPKILQKSK